MDKNYKQSKIYYSDGMNKRKNKKMGLDVLDKFTKKIKDTAQKPVINLQRIYDKKYEDK